MFGIVTSATGYSNLISEHIESNTLKTQLTVAPGWHQFVYYMVPANGSGIQSVWLYAEVK